MSARRQSLVLIAAVAVLLFGSAVRLHAVPSAPINLTAIVVGSTVTLTWNSTSVQPLFGHRLEAGLASQLSNLASVLIGTSTVFVVPNVPAGTYFVRVRAVGVDGDSAPSNEIVVTVGSSGCTTPPAPPVNLTSVVEGSFVALNWSSGAGCPATNFVLHAGSAPFSSNLAILNLGDTLTFGASAPDGTYYLRLYAENLYGSSGPSNEVTAVVGRAPTWLWGYVVDGSGVCIEGATVEVVGGQRLGERITQETPCTAWDVSGGFVFHDLTPGVEMIIRASAPGYAPLVKSVTPYLGGQTAFLFPLSKIESASTWLLGYVVDGSGICIEGGTVEVGGGQRLGERITQETPCDAWAYSGGFVFHDLTPGVEMIIRATAPGYTPLVESVTPYSEDQTAFWFLLSKIN